MLVNNAALDLTDLISVGDPLYRAPEFVSAIVGNRPSVSLTPAMDVWAVALICLELILPQPLFAATLANAAPPTGPSNDRTLFAALAREQSAPIALPPEVEDFSPALLPHVACIVTTRHWFSTRTLRLFDSSFHSDAGWRRSRLNSFSHSERTWRRPSV